VALYVVRDADEARDIVAKVFAALWERRARLTVATTFEAYLFGAVRNEARHARRDVARRSDLLSTRVRPGRDDASLQGRRLAEGGAAADATDLELTFDHAVRLLPDRYQLAIYLRWHRGMEYAEVGDVLGLSGDAARMLVTRALGMLRRHLREL
jgi:RNA polymerase sigma-70 factor (ECF subfamily)